MEITLAVILSYISNYLLAFTISLIGAFTSELMAAMRTKSKINLIRVLAPGIFDGFLLCAIQAHFNFSFPIYVFICFLLGMWGLYLLQILTNHKFVAAFLKNILKASASSVAKAAEHGLSEIEETTKDKAETDDEDRNDKKENDSL